MKKLFLSSFFLAAGFLICHAQETVNDPNVEKRNVSSFHGIEVSTGIVLMLSQSGQESVAVSASTTEYRDRIITKVEGGILKIYYEKKLSIQTKNEKKELRAYVSIRDIDRLDANSGAQVDWKGILKSPGLTMKVNTGAVVKGMIEVDDLSVDQNTGSIVTLSGDAGKLKVDGDTGSMFRGADLKTDNCNATSSTGAGIYITVQKELNVKANTGGYLKYKGDAGIREVKTSTGGSVSKI